MDRESIRLKWNSIHLNCRDGGARPRDGTLSCVGYQIAGLSNLDSVSLRERLSESWAPIEEKAVVPRWTTGATNCIDAG